MKALFAGLAILSLAGHAWSQDAVLRTGDQVEVRLGGVPPEEISTVSGNYNVDGQGFLNLPHIGKVKAAGTTQADLQNSIEAAYRDQKIYTNPSITINVPMAARFVNVGGDVKGPRRVEFTPDLRILGAINAAGGFTDYANQKQVRLLRDGKVIVINVQEIRKDPSKDIMLRPGDSIEVPQSFW